MAIIKIFAYDQEPCQAIFDVFIKLSSHKQPLTDILNLLRELGQSSDLYIGRDDFFLSFLSGKFLQFNQA